MSRSERALESDRERITDLLLQIRGGEPQAMDRLFPLVYAELRRIAHRHLQGERSGHTLGTTGLVHETYFKLIDQTRVEWQDRGHFYRVASWAMRRVLVDYARRHRTVRRGGQLHRVSMDEDVATSERGETLLALDEALERLGAVSERLSQVVECRFFGGLTEEETAEALGVTARTVQRDWTTRVVVPGALRLRGHTRWRRRPRSAGWRSSACSTRRWTSRRSIAHP